MFTYVTKCTTMYSWQIEMKRAFLSGFVKSVSEYVKYPRQNETKTFRVQNSCFTGGLTHTRTHNIFLKNIGSSKYLEHRHLHHRVSISFGSYIIANPGRKYCVFHVQRIEAKVCRNGPCSNKDTSFLSHLVFAQISSSCKNSLHFFLSSSCSFFGRRPR